MVTVSNCVWKAVFMANICLHDGFIIVCCIAVLGHLPEGKAGDETVTCNAGMQQAGSQGIYRESTSNLCQDGFLFVSVYVLCVLPGWSFCSLVFTHLPALPVQLKASGCLPNTDRRPLMQPSVTGQPSSCHWPQRSPPQTHTHTPLNFCASSERPHIRC